MSAPIKKLTPAQDYAMRLIKALSGFIDNPGDPHWRAEIMSSILQRPMTLRSALASYLYKSRGAQVTKGIIPVMDIR